MRYLPGKPSEISNESITSYSLMQHAVNNPDILPTVYTLWEGESTPLSSILNIKGLKSKGLFDGMSTKNFRVVGSNHVQYPIKNSDRRKMRLVARPDGKTWECEVYPTEPGKNQSVVKIYTDINWAGPKDVLELNDNNTQIYIVDHNLPEEYPGAPGVWEYLVKIVTKEKTEFIDPELLIENSEMAVVMTMHEHDFSESGNEKYTFDGWGHAYMTLQRLKMSWSGTAAAMKEGKYWTMHNGQVTFLTYAENEMMKRAAKYHEYALIFGKGTVTENGETLMKDLRGREIMAGQGLLHQNDGAYEYPYNGKWTKKFMESIMMDVDARVGNDGLTEVVMLGGQRNIWGFYELMGSLGITQNQNIVGDGASKGINNTYAYYEIGGIRIIPKHFRWFDSEDRPHKNLPDGTRKGQYDAIFVPIGQTEGGDKGVELIQLRPPKTGTVSGIDKGGEMATSVDGSHKHFLFQTGIVSRNKVMRMFRPYR